MQGKNATNITGCDKYAPGLIGEFLGAAHVFASAVQTVLEEELLRDASYGQLSSSQLKLLKMISLNDSLTVGDAAAFLKVSKAAASKAVDKLVRKQYLQRNPGKVDRRETRLSLTEASRGLLSRYESEREKKLKEIFSMSMPAELRQVSALLDCLTARIAIENFSAEPGKLCMQCGTYFRESCLLRTQLGRDCFHLKRRQADS
jgi:DNA-binding MarR family transcriptional regulator